MEEMGFAVEEIAYNDLLPELRTADADMMRRIRASYSKMIEWRLTAKKESIEDIHNTPQRHTRPCPPPR